jgi:hypothetical protein
MLALLACFALCTQGCRCNVDALEWVAKERAQEEAVAS